MDVVKYGNKTISMQTISEANEKELQRWFKLKIPKRFWKHKFDTLIPQEHKNIVIDSFNSLFSDSSFGLFFYGGVGVGKTSTLYLLYRMFARKLLGDMFGENDALLIIPTIADRVEILTYFDAVRELREKIKEDEYISTQAFPESLRKEVLFIDDLGRGYDDKAGWNRALFSELIDYRWSRDMATFFSSNRTPKALQNYLNIETIDRILDANWCRLIEYEGFTKRQRQNIKENHVGK